MHRSRETRSALDAGPESAKVRVRTRLFVEDSAEPASGSWCPVPDLVSEPEVRSEAEICR